MLIGQALENLSNSLSNGFNGLEKKLDRDLKIKGSNNTKLIDFQRTINNLNRPLHIDIKISSMLNLKDKNGKNKYESLKTDVHNVCIRLIIYISLWDINVRQGMIHRSIVKKSVGPLLAEEHIALKSILKVLIDKRGIHYADACNCKQLFDKCENKDTYRFLLNHLKEENKKVEEARKKTKSDQTHK